MTIVYMIITIAIFLAVGVVVNYLGELIAPE